MKQLKPLVIVLALMLAGCSPGSNNKANVVARFDGGVLTTEDIAAHYNALKRQDKYRQQPEMLTPEFVFEHALNMEMIIAKGLQKQLHLDAYIRQDLHKHMSNLFLKVLEGEMIQTIDKDSLSEEEVRAFYEANKDVYHRPAYYNLRAFEVSADQGEEVMAKLTSGELNFNEAAFTYALGDKEKQNGGQTGSRTLRRFQPAWRPVIESLVVGRLTGPVQIDGKSYVLLLDKKSLPQQYSFEDKAAYVRNDLLYNLYRDQWQQAYDKLRQEFRVEINHDRLSSFYKELGSNEEKS